MIDYHPSQRRAFGLACAFLLLGLAPRLAQAGEAKISRDVVYGTILWEKPATDAAPPANGTPAPPEKREIKLLLDVYEPEGFTGRRPGLVLIHGGGWYSGDKGSYK